MLFDLEDFATTGWIGYGAGRRYQNDERTIANSGDLEDYATTFRAVRDAHIKAINERFNNSIHLLPINKRSIAVQKYFAWMDSLRDFHIYNTRYPSGYTKFTGMLSSLRVIPVEGGVTFNEGDLLGIKDVSELTEEEIATLPDVRRLASDTGGPYKWKIVEDGWLVYVLFDQEWLDVYFAKFDVVVQAEKEMIIALEGLTENFAPYVAPVVVPSVKFKHGVSAGQTFDGTIKTTTGFVKFVIGKEEFLLGSTGSTGDVNFTIPVSATSKKSGNFISCDASGVGSGDILEIEIDSSLSSINLSNAPELTRFVATNGTFGSLSLTKNTKLTYLDVSGVVSLTSLNVSGLTLLEELYCQGCSIGTLSLTGMVNLTRIEAANNKLSGINLTGLTSLNYADFGNNFFMPSSRGPLLIDLDLVGSTGGTLIAPLEGRNSDSDSAYTSLISKGWTLTSDGIPLSKGIYGSSISGANFAGWFLTTTGYFKVVSDSGVLIKGDISYAINENSDFYTQMDENNSSSPIWNYIPDQNVINFNIPGGCPNGYAIHPCDAEGNITGDVAAFELMDNDKLELLDLDLSKIQHISLNASKVPENLLNDIPVRFDLDLYSAISAESYVLDVSGMNLRRFRSGYSVNELRIKGLNLLVNSIAHEHLNMGLESDLSSPSIFDMTGISNLKTFNIGCRYIDPNITSFDFSGLSNITYLDIGGNNQNSNVESINMSNCPLLEQVGIGSFYPINGNSFSFDIDNNPSLTSINVANCRLVNNSFDYFEFSTDSPLITLSLGNVSTKIKVNTIPTLVNLYLGRGFLTHITIENQPNIQQLYLESAGNLTELSINGTLSTLKYFIAQGVSSNNSQGFAIDFAKFPNTWEANFNYSRIKQIDNLSLATQLRQIHFGQANETFNSISLDLSSCTQLNFIELSRNFTGDLNVSNTKLTNLHLSYTKWKTVNVSNTGTENGSFAVWGQNAGELTSIIGVNNNPKVWRIDLSQSKVTSLDVSGSTNLNTVYASSNSLLTSVNVSGCTNLVFLTVNYNPVLTSIITSSSTRFGYFNSNYSTSLTSLDFSNVSNIFDVQCFNCTNLTSIIGLSNKTQLQGVRFQYTKVSNIDLSGCTGIRYVYSHYTQFSPSATDALLVTISQLIGNNWGQILIRENRTSASNAAYQILINKGIYVAWGG